jgi:hypothetical protein
VFACTVPQDMRRSVDGLALATKQEIKKLRKGLASFLEHASHPARAR